VSSRSYVCTSCRTSRRAPAAYGRTTDFRCSICGGPLWELEWRWRIPRQADDKGWRELAEKVAADAKRWLPRKVATGLDELKKLDRMIATTVRQKDSEKKTKKLRVLKNERKRVVHDYV
jgi:hypothetical protein